MASVVVVLFVIVLVVAIIATILIVWVCFRKRRKSSDENGEYSVITFVNSVYKHVRVHVVKRRTATSITVCACLYIYMYVVDMLCSIYILVCRYSTYVHTCSPHMQLQLYNTTKVQMVP